MAITLVGTPQGGGINNGNDVTLTFDGSRQEGDMVLLLGGNSDDDGSGDVGPSTAGYTQRHLIQDGGDGVNLALGAWTKFMGATPDSTVVGLGSGSAQEAAAYVSFVLRGVDPTTILDVSVVVTGPTSGASPNLSGLTTITNGAWVFAAVFATNTNSLDGYPTGYSNGIHAAAVDTRRFAVAAASKEVASAGSEDPGAYDWSGLSANWYGLTIAIRPAGGAAPVSVALAPASMALSAQAQALSLGALATALAPAALSLSAQALSPSLSPLAVPLAPASLQTAAQALDLSLGALVTQLSPASLVLTAQDLTPQVAGTGVVVSLMPANLAISSQALTSALAPLQIGLVPASLSIAPQILTPVRAPLQIPLSPASMVLSAQALTLDLVALAVPLTPATLSMLPQELQPPLSAVTVVLVPAELAIQIMALDPKIKAVPIPSGSDLAAFYRRAHGGNRPKRIGFRRPPSWR